MPSRETVFATGNSNLHRSRSVFDLSHKNTLTMKAGHLYPVLTYSDVIPGMTHKMSAALVARSTTPVTAVMDDAYIQVEFWWVPNKLTLSRASMSPSIDDSNHSWKAVIGAQDNLLNVDPATNVPELPKLNFDGSFDAGTSGAKDIMDGYYKESPAHYMDYPIIYGAAKTIYGTNPKIAFNPFGLLAFYQVWSDAYREPNLWTPVTYSVDSDGFISFTKNAEAGIFEKGQDNIYKLEMPHVCREHGYFGSSLPWPQRNLTGVNVPLGDLAPVVVGDDHLDDFVDVNAMHWVNTQTGVRAGVGNVVSVTSGNSAGIGGILDTTVSGTVNPTAPGNLWTDLSQATGATINSLRYSFALQHYYENLARMGNRYDDVIRRYGVSIDAPSSDKAEYLGGKRIPLSMSQVTASAVGSDSPLGSIGGMSNTSDSSFYFTKSFNDFGTICGVAFIRHHDTLGNRLSKERSRLTAFDYFMPEFANIGEVAVYRNELFINTDSTNATDGLVADVTNNVEFGFQEYAADYRYHEDEAHGEVSPELGTMRYWTYATDWGLMAGVYGAGEVDNVDLGMFLDAATQVATFDQTLITSEATAGYQYLVQFYFDWKCVAPIPQHSIPAVLGAR